MQRVVDGTLAIQLYTDDFLILYNSFYREDSEFIGYENEKKKEQQCIFKLCYVQLPPQW